MTKLVQPNVLRAYQSGEQYAINELVLYNSVPAYTNTALAQGVAGTAGNFTNIGGNTFSDSLFRIQDNDDATKQIAFEASGVWTGTTKTISMPNRDVDLTATPFHKYVSGTSEVVPYSLGEVIYSIGGTGVSIDVTQMAMLKIRSHRTQPSIDSATTTAVTLTTTNANGQRLLDESRTTIGDIVVGTPLVITLKAFETWEIRQGPLVGLIQCFIVKKTFDPALIVGQMKIRNSLMDGLGWTTAGAVTVDRTITLPNANVNLGKIPSSMSYSAGSISLTTADATSLVAVIGDLPAYATTNSNSITGSLSQILGGTGNNAVGTNTIMIGGKYNYNMAGANFQTYINAQNVGSNIIKTINARISSSATFSGSATSDIKCISVEYNLMNNHVSNTYATADTVQTLDAFHLPRGVIGVRGHAIHELSFIAIQNNAGAKDNTFQDPRISGKRLFHVNSDYSGAVTISSIQTIGTDYSTDAATLSITLDGSGLILIAITSGFIGGSTNISLMCNLRSTYTYTDWI